MYASVYSYIVSIYTYIDAYYTCIHPSHEHEMFKSVKGKDKALNPKIPRKSCFEVGICFLSLSHINQ